MRYSNTVENAEQRMHNQRALSKENKRKTLPLLFIALLAPPVHAQNSYTFEQSTAAYTELPGGIVCDRSLSSRTSCMIRMAKRSGSMVFRSPWAG
ncbi:MAG: hypothetical protein IPH53_21595 [Flavobacteriales bacterium]|nr:hypothetical protein [Flavobacteriales bacterium]